MTLRGEWRGVRKAAHARAMTRYGLIELTHMPPVHISVTRLLPECIFSSYRFGSGRHDL
jgi:hypothetical protein